MVKKLFLTWIMLVAAFSASADEQINGFRVGSFKDKVLCPIILENLNYPDNEDFGSILHDSEWDSSWETHTSEFAIMPKYRNQIKWVKWKPIEAEEARKYFKSEKVLSIIDRTEMNKYEEPHSYSIAEVAFDTEGKYRSKLIRFQSHDIRYTKPFCYLPETEKSIFSKEYIKELNQSGLKDCGFFYFQRHIHHSSILDLAFRTVIISQIGFNPQTKRPEFKLSCNIAGPKPQK